MADFTASPSWPRMGTPLFPGVVCKGFGPVTREVLTEIVRRVIEAFHPEKIILFGSYAYGHPTSDSDVDLLVILDTDQGPAERQVAVSRLIRPRPFPVDVLVKTPYEIQVAVKRKDPLILEILQRGKVLYG